jgi:signal transduction histidine kinase
MLSRLTSAQQQQRSLVSDTAHELRSPIASIRTQLEVALDHPAGQDWPSTARDVLADTLRLSRLAEDLLLLARLDEQADQGDIGRGEPLDVGELACSVVARYADSPVPVTVAPLETDGRTQMEASDGTVDGAVGLDLADGDTLPPAARWPVRGNRDRLDRMLVNLIDNAVRYAKSSVTVSVGQSGSWVELAVTDDGPGIPEADRERAFDRFARLDDARTRCDDDDGGGAGLGLAIVRATAQSHGGTARLESAPDASSGLRAVVRLPGTTEPAASIYQF